MTIHVLQHVHFESPGYILEWANEQNIKVTYTRFFKGDELPDIQEIDGLVIMGGPMSVYDEEHISWLAEEKAFIRSCIYHKIPVLGICLGAQLIADVLGARVYPHSHQEIGWFPIQVTSTNDRLSEARVFHWHGDTYDLPQGAIHVASSEGCYQQAFTYKNHVLALQFHLEVGREEVNRMLAHDSDDIGEGPYVQSISKIKEVEDSVIETNKRIMSEFLQKLFIDVSL